MSDELLAAGFSAMLNKKVMTQAQFDAYKKTPEGGNAVSKKLTIETVHQVSLHDEGSQTVSNSLPEGYDEVPPEKPCLKQYQIFAQCGSSKRACLMIYHCDTIARLKYVVMQKLDIRVPPEEVRLTYQDRDLSASHKSVVHYYIRDNAEIKVLLRIRDGSPLEEILILDSSQRDPTYDYQFPSVSDGLTYYRGPHEYFRPYGWNRLALKVKGKFEDDTWLGEDSVRTSSSPGEWSVSYHGTPHINAPDIAEEGFKLNKGKRFLYGKGIYSSPNIEVAEYYATAFEHGGETYKLVFQSRCNPDDIVVVNNGNLVYWITKNDKNIRPYGICIKGARAISAEGWCTIS